MTFLRLVARIEIAFGYYLSKAFIIPRDCKMLDFRQIMYRRNSHFTVSWVYTLKGMIDTKGEDSE